jgi:hypothetical protein
LRGSARKILATIERLDARGPSSLSRDHGIGNSVIVPAGVVCATSCAPGSVNHTFPSGPAVIPQAVDRIRNSVVSREPKSLTPIRSNASGPSVNQMFRSGSSAIPSPRKGDWGPVTDSSYDLVIVDPPYSNEEAAWLYGTPPLKRGRYVAEAVRVCKPGGHVCLYQIKQPTRPQGTRLVRRIVILTRSGHAARVCFVFEKLA